MSANSASFTPNQDALKTLLEMGYEREDAMIALRIADNNLEGACTFLISNPNPSVTMPGISVQLNPSNLIFPSLRPHASREAQIGYATQLAAQTQQRTQALYQDVTRLEQALQQLVQVSSQMQSIANQP